MKKRVTSIPKIWIYSLAVLFFLVATHAFPQGEKVITRWKWDGVSRIVAIGDLHGDVEAFTEILLGTGLVKKVGQDEYDWIGGKTHLVQLGDVMDRGIYGHYCFDLLKRLEKQAEEAGGKVHVLIGNHEEANIYGTAPTTSDYVAPQQFWYFLGEEYKARREKPLRDKYGDGDSYNLELEEKILDFWKKVQADQDDDAQEVYQQSFVRQYGEWLITKNVVIQINDIIFAHGGVNESFSEMDIGEINKLMRADLNKLKTGKRLYSPPRVAYQPEAPQWWRGLIREDEDSFSDDVDRILANLHAHYMVVGHTVRRTRKLDRFNGRIWGIDTGNSKYYGGVRCALIIEDGNFSIWWGDSGIEPVSTISPSRIEGQVKIDRGEMEHYLRTATIMTAIPDENLGRTEPWIIDLSDGQVKRKGFFKHVNRCRPATFADCYKYELAAYELSKLLDLEIVLPVVERVIKARPGSLAMFLPENWVALKDMLEDKKTVKDEQAYHRNMLDVLVFDNLCYTGQDPGELNEDTYVDLETGFICRIDFSQGFAPEHDLIPEREVTQCSERLHQNLMKLKDGAIRDAMKPYLNADEIEALLFRKRQLLEKLEGQR